MAFVLGDIIESHFRRALTLSKGSYAIFFNRPACIVINLMIAALVISSVYRFIKKRREERANTHQKG